MGVLHLSVVFFFVILNNLPRLGLCSLLIQNRLLRSAKYYLDKDRKDKFQAHGIDNKCASLENTSAGLHFAKDAVKVEKK